MDLAIVSALTKTIINPSTPNVRRAITIAEAKFDRAKGDVEMRTFLREPPRDLDSEFPYFRRASHVRAWMSQVTAGLMWSVTGHSDKHAKWDDAWSWSPNFVVCSGPLQLEDAGSLFSGYKDVESVLKSLSWRPGWSSTPRMYPRDIYRFEVCVQVPGELRTGVLLRHVFYNELRWYVAFTTSEDTWTALVGFLDELEGSEHG